MHTHWIERLSEYRDGELPAADRDACQAHLAECARCSEVLEELDAVVAIARLDEDRTPSTDLWPGVMARITGVPHEGSSTGVRYGVHGGSGTGVLHGVHGGSDTGVRHEVHGGADGEGPAGVLDGSRRFGAGSRRQVTFTLPQLALAASLLIAVSAAVAYVAAGRTAGTPPLAYETPILAVAELASAPAVHATPANFADAQFDQAVADLERTLVEQRDALDPRTIVVIERNLRTIDEAIRQAREALDADPSNTFLNSHLAEARKRKIELLRRATSIAGD